MKLTQERVDELLTMAVNLILETEFFHPIIWADALKNEEISLEELYWLRDNVGMEVEMLYDGDGEG